MATSLLLEGDDLEQLLLRAQREGGPRARIVRAEKIRHGGVMGFFARETFEVALEIPDDDDGAAAVPAGRPPVEALLARMQDVDTSEIDTPALTPGDHVIRAGQADDDAVDDESHADSDDEAAADDTEQPARPPFTPFGEVFQAAARTFGVAVEASTETADDEDDEDDEAEADADAEADAQADAAEVVTEEVAEAEAEGTGAADSPTEPSAEPAAAESDIEAPAAEALSGDTAVGAAPAEAVDDADDADDPVDENDPVDEDATPAVAAEADPGADAPADEDAIPPADPTAEGDAPIADEVDQIVTTVAGRALAEPMPSAEILTAPAELLAAVEDSPVRRRIEARRRRAPLEEPDRREPSPRPAAAVPHGMLDPMLATERSASRSVAGQPLAEPQDLAFSVPLQRTRPTGAPTGADQLRTEPDPLPTSTLEWEREISIVARSAAYAAVYATMHDEGVPTASRAARFALVEPRGADAWSDPLTDPDPLTGPLPEPRGEQPTPVLGDELLRRSSRAFDHSARASRSSRASLPSLSGWRPGRHSSERGTAQGSGHWALLPTTSGMVTGFSDVGSDRDPSSDDSSSDVRPEFAALLERLRSASGVPADSSGRHAAPEWPATGLDGVDSTHTGEHEPLIAEPIAAEVAWSVVEQSQPIGRQDETPGEPTDQHTDQPTAEPTAEPTDDRAAFAALSPETGQALVESIRRQAQAAIDEVFSAAGLAEEAERMQRAAGTIPMPRRSTFGEASTSDAPVVGAADPAEPSGLHGLSELHPAELHPAELHHGTDLHADVDADQLADLHADLYPETAGFDPHPLPLTDDRRLLADQAVLRGLGVPETWVQRLQSGDRYAAVWHALDELPVPVIDPDAAVVAVIGAPSVVRLEAHRVAVELADGDDPLPVVLVPAGGEVNLPAEVGRHPRCVVAIESDGTGDPSQVLEHLGRIAARAVIAVLDADSGLAETRSWLFSLGCVDAVALDGVLSAAQPAAMLQLGVPITRLDGIPIDRLTWTALLCAQLEGADPA